MTTPPRFYSVVQTRCPMCTVRYPDRRLRCEPCGLDTVSAATPAAPSEPVASSMYCRCGRRAGHVGDCTPTTPAAAPSEPVAQYATMGEMYNYLANELDETRTRDEIARLTVAVNALDVRVPLFTRPAPREVTDAMLSEFREAVVVAARIDESDDKSWVRECLRRFEARLTAARVGGQP